MSAASAGSQRQRGSSPTPRGTADDAGDGADDLSPAFVGLTRATDGAALRAVIGLTGVIHVEFEQADSAIRLDILNNPDQGRLAFLAPPDGQLTGGGVAREMLRACGVDRSIDLTRHEDDLTGAVLPRLLFHGVQDVLVEDAHRLHRDPLEWVLNMCAAAGARVWLISHEPMMSKSAELLDAHTGVTQPLGALRVAFSDVPEAFELGAPRPPAGDETSTDGDGLPLAVPDDDFLTFLSSARQCLHPPEFAVVRKRYADAVDRYRRLVTQALQDFGQHQLSRRHHEERIARWLHEGYQRCGSTSAWQIELRAAQLAFWEAGLLLRLRAEYVAALAPQVPSAAHRSTHVWARGRRLRHPYKGAALALAALGIGPGDMTAMTLADVRFDGSAVRHEGQWLRLEAGSEELLHLLVIDRLIVGASPSDALFVTVAEATPMGDRTLAEAVRSGMDVGVVVSQYRVDRKSDRSGPNWLRRWGLSVQELRQSMADRLEEVE